MPAARLGGADRGFDGLLQIGSVGRRSIVEDDEINGQALETPVFLRTQQLLDDFKVVLVVYADEDDGKVAGHAERP